MSVTTDAAEELKDLINAGDFSLEFTAERKFLPKYALSDLEILRVDVVPSSIETEAASRTSDEHDISVMISIQKRFADESAAEVIDGLADELRDFCSHKNLDSTGVKWYKTSRDGFLSVDRYDEENVFHSYVRVHYKYWS